MPAKIPHPQQFSKCFLLQAEKLLQRRPSLCIAGHRVASSLVLHVAAIPLAYEVQAKRLTIIVQQKFHPGISAGEVCGLLECT